MKQSNGLENKRVIAYSTTVPATPVGTINLYSPDGKRMGYYRFSSTNGWTTTTALGFQNFLYLGNKALTYSEDRIGSTGNYYPYGNGYVASGPEAQNFGTYVQDESGLLYADQRHYNPNFGRFMTADRSNANIDYGNPTSWNRYAYTNGDPVNGMDPSGQQDGGADFSTLDTHAVGLVGADTSGGYSGSSGDIFGNFFQSLQFISDYFSTPSSAPSSLGNDSSGNPFGSFPNDAAFVSNVICPGSCYLNADPPTYVTLTAGAIDPLTFTGGQASLSVDQNGTYYFTSGGLYGTPGLVLSLSGNWIPGGPYSPSDVESFASGPTASSSATFPFLIGGGSTFSPNTDPGVSHYSIDVTVGTPGISGGLSNTKTVGNVCSLIGCP